MQEKIDKLKADMREVESAMSANAEQQSHYGKLVRAGKKKLDELRTELVLLLTAPAEKKK